MATFVKRSGATLVAVLLLGGMVTFGSSAAHAAGEELRVDIRAELDLPGQRVGPVVFEALDVLVGPGPELTGANLVENPSEWCGDVRVDIDPDTSTITVSADEVACDFVLVSLVITSDSFASIDLVSDELLLSEGGAYNLDFGVADGAVYMTWTVSSEEATSMDMAGSAVFSYTLVAAVPEVVVPPVVDEAEPAAVVVAAAPIATLAETGAEATPLLWMGLLLAAAGVLAFTATRVSSRTR